MLELEGTIEPAACSTMSLVAIEKGKGKGKAKTLNVVRAKK
jgi:hypothetical protein